MGYAMPFRTVNNLKLKVFEAEIDQPSRETNHLNMQRPKHNKVQGEENQRA